VNGVCYDITRQEFELILKREINIDEAASVNSDKKNERDEYLSCRCPAQEYLYISRDTFFEL